MKRLFILLITACLFEVSFSQVTDHESKLRTQTFDTLLGWKKGGVINLGMSQLSLTNWAAGGQNSIAINGLFYGFVNYKGKKATWDNSLNLGYGLQMQGSDSKAIKTDDKVDLLSVYGMKA